MVHSVTTVDWQNILKLLMLTMLSDGRVYEREVDIFVNASESALKYGCERYSNAATDYGLVYPASQRTS